MLTILPVSSALTAQVVIHDLKTKDPENSIVYIENGHVTNRGIGDGPSNAVFDVIRHNNNKTQDEAPGITPDI